MLIKARKIVPLYISTWKANCYRFWVQFRRVGTRSGKWFVGEDRDGGQEGHVREAGMSLWGERIVRGTDFG